MVWVSGFGVWGLGFRVWGLGFRVQGSGFRVQGSGFRIQGLGFRAHRDRALERGFLGFGGRGCHYVHEPVLHGVHLCFQNGIH